jgi:hypothetical protein
VFDSFGLTEKAKRHSVSISESIDASKISSNLSCITAGFKVYDIAAVYPITKIPWCTGGLFSNVQSRNNVSPLKLLLAKLRRATMPLKVFLTFLLWLETKEYPVKEQIIFGRPLMNLKSLR